jgi:hypothetical protein
VRRSFSTRSAAIFVAAGVEVLDRENLERILGEHKFNLSGYVDSSTSARLGRMTGAEAIVFVRVNRCEAKQDAVREQFTDRKGVVHYNHKSKTTADFGASVKTVDLTTGRTFAAVQIDEQTMRENRSENCCPEFPSIPDALDDAVAKGVVKVHRMFFPWTEDVELRHDREHLVDGASIAKEHGFDRDCRFSQSLRFVGRMPLTPLADAVIEQEPLHDH